MPNDTPLSERVALQKLEEDDRALIDGLAQFYIYDFSEMGPIEDRDFDLGPDGRFSDLPDIDRYWRDSSAIALVIRYEGRVAGFVLIDSHSHRDNGHVERNMGEFFVARQFRHCGIADEALRQVLSTYPGRWEAAVLERNRIARSFWPRAIGAAPNVSDLICVEGDGVHWTGPIWCFTAV